MEASGSESEVPRGLRRCESCGEYRGRARRRDEAMVDVSCSCVSITCTRCGQRPMRPPLSNYVASDGRLIHVPAFAGLMGCDVCRPTRSAAN